MSKHSHISAIFDNAFQSRAGSPDVYMSMVQRYDHPQANGAKRRSGRKPGARVTNFVLVEFKVVARDR